MNYRKHSEISHQTVLNFRFFDPAALATLGRDLTLSLSEGGLWWLREHFRLCEQRDPTVGELQFFSDLRDLWLTLPASAELQCNAGNEELMRTLADAYRMRAALPSSPMTADTLLSTAGQYLARGGIPPYHKNLLCGSTHDMAARACGENPTLALDLGRVSAMLSKTAHTPLCDQSLLLLRHTGNAPFPLEVARFLAAYRHLGLFALTAPCGEGILPHLLSLGHGFVLDLAPFFEVGEPLTPSAALSVGKDAVLIAAHAAAVPYLMANGAPVTPCGSLISYPKIQIRSGPTVLLSLSTAAFAPFLSTRPLSITAKKESETQIASSVTASDTLLMGGVCVKGGCMHSLLTLIGELAAMGADAGKTTLTAVLEMPPLSGTDQAEAALPALLELHRVSAELSLPCVAPRLLMREELAEPTLTVFACAERKSAPDGRFSAEWQAAADAKDFATMRRLLHAR